MADQPITKTRSASAGELHAMPMPTDGDRAELWVMHPTQPALVMGSSQKPELFDQNRLDRDRVELAARRSGGGAVFIDPQATVWIDVLAPRISPWWSSELVENFLLVGRVWQHALASLGVVTELCTDAPGRTDASAVACWAGIGWGELTIGDAKVVGLSQRRTRWGARIQAMAVVDGSSRRVLDYLPSEQHASVSGALESVTVDVNTADLQAAVIAAFSTN